MIIPVFAIIYSLFAFDNTTLQNHQTMNEKYFRIDLPIQSKNGRFNVFEIWINILEINKEKTNYFFLHAFLFVVY